MFEQYDFDYLIDRMLSNVSTDLDKREGSIIYDALAPSALELANFYTVLDMVMEEVFADTASYYYLIKRAAERGKYPKEETHAVLKMLVTPADCQIKAGDRFNLDMLNYSVLSPIDGEAGAYKVSCETGGTAGNQQLGILTPIEFIAGMESAALTEVLIPGEDEEEVEAFRERYFASFRAEAFGGNKADYLEKVNRIDGVGGCKIKRAWNGGIKPSDLIPGEAVKAWYESQSTDTLSPDVYQWMQGVYMAASQKLLTVGGKTKVTIISSEYKAPSTALVESVQEILDPVAGEGDGTAPIGHVVNVSGVRDVLVSCSFRAEYKTGFTFSGLKPSIDATIDTYFLQLSQEWAGSQNLIVRMSQIETLLLALEGIVDIAGTQINGKEENLILDEDCIPVRGDVSG